jgi:S-formylglutathione hydrolase FrmB
MNPLHQQLAPMSLMHGWIPVLAQVAAAAAVLSAIGWRSRRWHTVWLPAIVFFATAIAAWVRWYIGSVGVASGPAPWTLWAWIAVTVLAAAVLVVGWARIRWWRRALSAMAVPLCLLCVALVVNGWVGYFPTVDAAWNQLSAAPLPDQADRDTVTAMQLRGAIPARGVVVPVNISGDASKFKHRSELAYLPPVWFGRRPAPQLPVVMMIGAQFNNPSDWLRAGNAIRTVDTFAAGHHGNAPVLVFVDSNGSFDNDTECVDGPRGNAADHLTKDVVPYMIKVFEVSPNRENWGVAGFSTGGTCAVDLTVMHPELFSAFLDIGGDLSPNAGNKAQTIDRLFGGRASAWAAFDPTTVMNRHGRYSAVAGWFAVAGPVNGGRPAAFAPDSEAAAAHSLCALGSAQGIRCTVTTQPGKHDWPFAADAFAAALPWLAGQLGTPGAPIVPLPGPINFSASSQR